MWSKAAQRAEQRLAELNERSAQWAERQAAGRGRARAGRRADRRGRRTSEVLAAQAEEQAERLPEFDEALRAAQARANEQRSQVSAVQQQIQVLAAESRNVDDQAPPAAPAP